MASSQANSVAKWSSMGGETGLEKPMWQLGLGGETESYPKRPDKADCIYYLKTGFCGYGPWCRFNHPRDRISIPKFPPIFDHALEDEVDVKDNDDDEEDTSESESQSDSDSSTSTSDNDLGGDDPFDLDNDDEEREFDSIRLIVVR